jgi:hypothetical protein
VKTRSSAQIRSHAQKYIIKLCKKFNIHDNKQLKTLKNLKKGNSKGDFLGLVDNLNLLGQSKFTEEDIANLDMEQIEEAILGIFKNSGLGSTKKNDICNINNINFEFSGDEGNDQSDDKKKLFETVKEPRYKKKKYNGKTKVFQTQQGGSWPQNKEMGAMGDMNGMGGLGNMGGMGLYNYLMMNQGVGSPDFANLLMRSQMAQIGNDMFNQGDQNLQLLNLLKLTRNDNSLLKLNNNLIQNIIGTDYNTNNIPLLNNNIFGGLNGNHSSNHNGTNLASHNNVANNLPKSSSIVTTQDNETLNNNENLDDLSKLQNLQMLSDVMKILSNNNLLNSGSEDSTTINVNNLDPSVIQMINKLNSNQPVCHTEEKKVESAVHIDHLGGANNINTPSQVDTSNFLRNQPTQTNSTDNEMGYGISNLLNNLHGFPGANLFNAFNNKTNPNLNAFNQFSALKNVNPYMFDPNNLMFDFSQGFPLGMLMPQVPNLDLKNLMPFMNNNEKVEHKENANGVPFHLNPEQYIMNQLLINNNLTNQFSDVGPHPEDGIAMNPKIEENK